jgi:hypothetical protein
MAEDPFKFGDDAVAEEQAYDPDAILADPQAHPIHKMYAEINIGVRDRGEVWSKCANCGAPYQLTEAWTSDTVCGKSCFNDYLNYLNNPVEW